MTEPPRAYHCATCGHQHGTMPEGHVCLACGAAKVVDIRDPDREETLAVLQAKSRRNRGTADIKVALVGLVILCMGIVGLMKFCVLSRDAEEQAAAARLRGVRFISDTLPVDAPVLAGYHDTIVRGTGDFVPCWGTLEESRVAIVLTVRWVIGADGEVSEIGTKQDVSIEVLTCAEGVVEGWRFEPPPGGESLVVEAPLTFATYRGETRGICPESFAVVASDGTLRSSVE